MNSNQIDSMSLADFDRLLNNQDLADDIGRHLGLGLGLHWTKRTQRWDTKWGDKTNAGLARMVFAQIVKEAHDFAARGGA